MNTKTRRPRATTASLPIPTTQAQHLDLRELLESNLAALEALLATHHRAIATSLRALDGLRAELRAELRAFSNPRAPWVAALAETRALLYVALESVIVGNDTAGSTVVMSASDIEKQVARAAG